MCRFAVPHGKPQTFGWLEAVSAIERLLCSVLTVSELLQMVRQEELRKTETLIAGVQVVPVLYEDARKAADLMRDRGPGFVDCHIAATALRLNAAVMTYNHRDFGRTGVNLLPLPETWS